MNVLRFELLCAADVINVVGISAIDNRVAWLYNFDKLMKNSIDKSRRYHQPDGARRLEFSDEFGERGGANCALVYKGFHCLRATIVNDAFVAAAQEAPYHVRAHAAQ